MDTRIRIRGEEGTDETMKALTQGMGTGGLYPVFMFPLLIVACLPHICQHLVTAGRKGSLGVCIELEEKADT